MALFETKEIDPKITVARAQSFLDKINCFPKYTEYQNTPGVYTGFLDGGAWGLNSNGKGLSSDLCKASAYGEFLERLQNFTYGLAFHALTSTPDTESSFYLWPDEKSVSVIDAIADTPEIQRDLQSLWLESNQTTSAPDLFDLSYLTFRYFQSDMTILAPFRDVFNNTLRYFPMELIALINGSTGQCAGNTPEEALVQGLSEILERWCERQVLTNRLTPPEIPYSYIQAITPDLYEIILKYLEKDSARFNLKVYDLSFGQGLPVVGLVLFDKRNLGYRIQLGAHPLFRIALERCLTELEQGLELHNPTFDSITFNSWTLTNSLQASSLDSQAAQFRDGMGTLPDEWLANEPSWVFTPWGIDQNYTNQAGLTQLLALFKKNGIQLFIRDTTVSSLYTYIIYAPGISVAPRTILNTQLGLSQMSWAPCIDKEWEHCSYDEKVYLLNYLKKYGTQILGPRTTSTPGYYIATAIAMELEDFQAAWDFISQAYPTDQKAKLIKKEIELCLEGFELPARNKCLLHFFNEQDIEYLDNYWRQDSILEALYQEEIEAATYMVLDIEKLALTKKLLNNEVKANLPINQLDCFKWIDKYLESK